MPVRDLLNAAAGVGGAADPYFYDVSLLLTGDGTNGAQNNTFLDSSSNNFTITRNGNTTQGTFSPYGNLWSNYFDGNGDYIVTPSNAAFGFGTGDFTIECFVNTGVSSKVDGQTVFDTRPNGAGTAIKPWIIIDGSNKVTFGFGVTTAITGTTVLKAGVWYYLTVVKSSGTTKLYVNGVQEGSSYTDGNNYGSSNDSVIGIVGDARGGSYDAYFNGYISNLRIVKGTAVYTSNFTPSTTPLTAVSGTSLLTCQSNRFIDNSSNNFTLTVNGNTSVQRFSPFNPTAPYSASTIGGSGYFDGSGDYLSVASAFSFAGDFTVECFVFPTGTTGGYNNIWGNGNINNSVQVYIDNSTKTVRVNKAFVSGDLITGGVVSLTSWNHIALTRSGSTLTLWLNGVSQGTSTTSVVTSWGSNEFWIGNQMTGYISNFRSINTAIYTSAFTPPTAPLTAVSGTSILLNFTNAGIPDAAMMNDLETVGNAQVSTSVKKYGTGSLVFDGTGDWLQLPVTPQLYLGTTYTIEAWIYPSTVSDHQPIFTETEAFTGGFTDFGIYRNGTAIRAAIRTATNGAITVIEGGTVSTNTWYHVALSVNATSAKLFLNGTQIGSTTTFAEYPIAKTTYAAVGAWANGFTTTGYGPWNGYIDDLRITKGFARYTANFTPPTASLPTY